MRPWLRSWVQWATKESAGVVGKELLKWVLFGIAALFGASVLATLGNILQIDSDSLSWSVVWDKIWNQALIFAKRPFSYSIQALTEDPVRALASLGLASGYIVLLILLRRANRKVREFSVQRALAMQVGIGGRWPHARTNDPDGAPWDNLCREIARPDNNILWILGANGIETFGDTDAPLYLVMQGFQGNVRVILADPDGDETEGRARAVGVSVRDYVRAIHTSERRLRDLRGTHHAIEGRFYNGQPNWKFIITTTTAWVQYYAPGGRHVNETPVWRFDATENGESLYYVFRMEFERIWRRCDDARMDI